MKRDAIFYQIFQRFPGLLFELVEHPPADALRYRFESVEVKEPNFRIDGVFLPPEDASSKTVFFAEVQFQKDEDLYHRFIAESMLYLYRNRANYDDWYGVIIFPTRSLEPENQTVHRSLLTGDQLRERGLQVHEFKPRRGGSDAGTAIRKFTHFTGSKGRGRTGEGIGNRTTAVDPKAGNGG